LALLGYCTVENVKSVLQISEDKFGSELSECITSASALVDGYLACERLTVPSVVPQVLADATKYFAAWDFRRRRDPVGAEAFWNEATRILSIYLDAEKAPYVGSV
jgi:phage gp36-like protein